MVAYSLESKMRMGFWVVVCGLVGLAGCGGGAVSGVTGAAGGSQAATKVPGAKLTGVVHGGQNPISGAHVYLLAAASGAAGTGNGMGAAAYGGMGIAASASNASVSLLTSGTLDTSGGATNGDYYVTTGPDGSFSISNDYTCTGGQQVYLYVLGGDPGLGTGVNPAAGLMAALGNCPGTAGSTGNTFSSSLYVVVNEVTTVAAAYAMAGFATDATHVGSSGTALAQTGIANAFANAGNLAMLGTGMAATTTAGNNGTVPQAEIYTLANILASCVNSNGAVTGPTNATACYTLFTSATADGTVTGTQPTDTATAAINIAHNPGASVAALYGLAQSTPPFANGLTAQPNDWTVELTFSAPGFGIALDGSGNVWVASYTTGRNVIELSSSGVVLSGESGYTGAIGNPQYVTIDPSGNAWFFFAAGSNSALAGFSSTGSYIGSYNGAYGGGPSSFVAGATAVVSDGAGNIWVPTDYGLAVFAAFSGGGPIPAFTYSQWGGGFAGGAADAAGNVWVTPEGISYTPDFLAAYTSVGLYQIDSTGGALWSTGGAGLDYPWAVAIDHSGDVWVTNNVGNSVSEVSSAGAAISPSSGFTGGGLLGPYSLSVDGAGNVWVGGYTSENIVEFSNSGNVLSGATGYRRGDQNIILSTAVDGSGDVWNSIYTGSGQGEIAEILGVAAPVVTPLSVGAKNNMLGTRP